MAPLKPPGGTIQEHENGSIKNPGDRGLTLL